MFTHLFLNDDELREAFNRRPPRGDNDAFIASTSNGHQVRHPCRHLGRPGGLRASGSRVVRPVTLPYTVGTAASFDYTGFNGRALGDNVMDNMLSVLTNSPLGTGIAPDPARVSEEFPYFTRAVRA